MWIFTWFRDVLHKFTHFQHGQAQDGAAPDYQSPGESSSSSSQDPYGALSEVAAPPPILHPEREPEDSLEQHLSAPLDVVVLLDIP